MTRVAAAVFLVSLLSACAGSDAEYYRSTCLGKGHAEGSAAYEQCVARERAIIEDARRVRLSLPT